MRLALILTAALSPSISFAASEESFCVPELLPSTNGRPAYPVIELRESAVGAVVVRFIVLSNGMTSEHEIISSSSTVFERAARTYLERSRFPKRQTPCIHQLSIRLELKNGLWSVDASMLGNGNS